MLEILVIAGALYVAYRIGEEVGKRKKKPAARKKKPVAKDEDDDEEEGGKS